MEFLKKVKKADLRDLVWEQYLYAIHDIPLHQAHDQAHDIIDIEVNDVRINIHDKTDSVIEGPKLAKFTDLIDKITFGNLLVVDTTIDKDEKSGMYVISICIANKYQMI